MKIKLYYPFLEVNEAFEIGEADVSAWVMEQIAGGMREISFILIPHMTALASKPTVEATAQVHRIVAKVVRVRSSLCADGWMVVLNDHKDRRKVRTLKGKWVTT